ncbi:MAG: hypothetical protein GX754_11920 [Clostridiaceae bacterium]|nr:hypothetical protein [Clostridiaceae bacterium]
MNPDVLEKLRQYSRQFNKEKAGDRKKAAGEGEGTGGAREHNPGNPGTSRSLTPSGNMALPGALDILHTGDDGPGTAGEAAGAGLDIHNLIEGEIYKNEEGCCFITENRYPLTYLHGGCRLGDVAAGISSSSLKRLCPGFRPVGDDSAYNNTNIGIDTNIDIRDFLFLDIETTGLAGGVGTVAFLVGTGFFKDDSFVVRQYFMRDYDEEIAMLKALNLLFPPYKVLVTFNGKAFDMNIIRTRYTYNRTRCELDEEETGHIDLLLLARRLWKEKLESCSLSSLEENILGESRVDDIPGELIPQVYFKYVVDRDAREIKRVMKHNELDILSMVALLNKINNMLRDPILETSCDYELMGVGKVLESAGDSELVVECFEKCMKSGSPYTRYTALKKLTRIYKREGNYAKAVEIWDITARNQDFFSIFSLIELAKYYEHKEKNIDKAIEVTERAMRLSVAMGIYEDRLRGELKKRMERLKRKAQF